MAYWKHEVPTSAPSLPLPYPLSYPLRYRPHQLPSTHSPQPPPLPLKVPTSAQDPLAKCMEWAKLARVLHGDHSEASTE